MRLSCQPLKWHQGIKKALDMSYHIKLTRCLNSLIYADKNAMVLEDLTSLNFELANRRERFNLNRAKLVMEKIATFHAASAVLYENDPSSMNLYQASAVDGDEMTPLTFFFTVSMQETLETIRNSPELQQWLPLLENYDIVSEEKKVFTRNDTDRLHVLNHGDLWINNIFFKSNDKGESVDSLLVGFACIFIVLN